MRNADPTFFPGTEINSTVAQMRRRTYEDTLNILQSQWAEGDINQRFAMGDVDVWNMLYPSPVLGTRRRYTFPLINSHIQMISGYQRRNRKSSICIPIQSPLQKTADQMTKCLFYVHSNSGLYQLYSDSFEQGSLIQGLGFMGFHIDRSVDPVSGEIRGRYVDMKSCRYDPYFRKHDMSDARYFETRQFFDQKDAARLFPQLADQILSIPRGTYRDDKYYYMPENYQLQTPDLIAFDEYWYLSSREAVFMIDKETEEVQEFLGDEEDARVIKNEFKDRIKFIEKSRPTVRRAIFINDKEVVDESNPYGLDCYPYVPFLGYFTADTEYFQLKFRSPTYDMRSAQALFNRRKIADLDILESQQQGLKIRQGSLVTPEDALNQGNGRALFYKKDGSPDDIQPMPIIPPAPTMIQMEEMLQQLMSSISGVNETLLGTEVDSKAGIISMLRSSSGITTLTRLFDQFDESQRLCGEIIIQMIQRNWTYGKVKQVIGEEPTSEFDNKAFFKYGCKIVQGVLTESQQQLELAQILHLRELAGDIIPIENIVKAMTIQNKDEILESIKQKEQAAQEQQKKLFELQMQQMQVENQTKISYSHSQDSLAAERLAKVQLDKALNAERLQRAEEDRTGSVLNLVKAIKELQGMDLQQFAQALEIVQSLKTEEGQEVQNSSNKNKNEGNYGQDVA